MESKPGVESGFSGPAQTNSPSLNGSVRIKKKAQPFVKDLQGQIAVVIAYILFVYMWFLTVFYGIWDIEKKEGSDILEDQRNAVWAVFSTLIFSFFWLMMIISHWMTMRTSPGEMPKGYKKLQEKDLPKRFF